MHSVLLVCLGNICRSPSAEAVLRRKALERGLSLAVDSAGTGDWHIGKPPYGPMIAAAARRSYDLSPLRARQVSRADFDSYDMIVAMDRENRRDLRVLCPDAEVRLFMEFAPDAGPDEVPDPYFTRDFDAALDLIEQAADGLIDYLAQKTSAVSPNAV